MALILTLFLLTFTSIFSSNTSEKNMDIKATVIKPLRVIHNGDINYGKIIQGSTHSTTRHIFTIYGEPKQDVDITLNEKNINAQKNSIPLIHKENNSQTLSVQLKNEKNDGNDTKLNEKGEYRYSFDTELIVPPNALVGDYSGTLTMKVRFK
ncbi:DUF4402 domain-containing protein [Cetobacterium somerae]|uniref:DUF4402 domain-containing protein n=1 Tax=Cetobacterium sp. NK01 TaxID=2993530 RepID=UPI002115E83B|nr:DUF4402 domain-containing protein [Cetobacterium sp. NK01]MCQ8212276.1 DUF4402 domain-containing protein [Cetobacterium sp. NK01]